MVAATYHPVQLSNIECEIGVLSCLLLDPQAIFRVAEILPYNAFFTEANREIYQACLALYKAHQEVNLLSVTNWLADKNLLSKVGGRTALANLLGQETSSAPIDGYAEVLIEKYVRRQLANLAPEIESKASDTEKPLAWLMEFIESKVLSLTQLRKAKEGKGYWQKIDEITFERLCKDLEEVEDIENSAQRDWAFKKLAKKWKFSSKKELLDFHAKWLDSRNTTTTYTAKEYFQKFGQSDQDWLIPGFIPNQSVVVLYADGGVGKTRLAFTLAKHCVAGGTFAYDGTDFEAMNTLLIETDQGPRNTSKLLEMQDFLDDRYSCRLTICDDWTANEFGKLRAMLKRHQPKLVIIDSLTSISVDSLYSEKDAEYARPLVRLRHIAKEFNCSFLVIHHSNAGGDMRGSRAIRNTVDEVWKFSKSQNEVETFNTLTIDKTRSRGPGSYKFLYDDDTWGWKFAGRLEDSLITANMGQSTTNMQRCLKFLQENRGKAYEASEVAYELNLHKDSVRRDLKRAAGEGLCNTGRSTTNKRAVVYYAGTRSTESSTESKENIISDQVIRTDQIADHFQSNVMPMVSASSDQVINLITKSEEKNPEKIVEMADHFDHLITSTSNPDSDVVSEVISEVITSDQLITCNIPLQTEEVKEDSTEIVHPVQNPLEQEFPVGSWVVFLDDTAGSVAGYVQPDYVELADQSGEVIGLYHRSMCKLAEKPKALIIENHQNGILPVFLEGEYYFSVKYQSMVRIFQVNDTLKSCSCNIPFKGKTIRTDLEFSDLKKGEGSYYMEIAEGDRVEILTGKYKGQMASISSQMPNQGPVFLRIDGVKATVSSKTTYWGHQIRKI